MNNTRKRTTLAAIVLIFTAAMAGVFGSQLVQTALAQTASTGGASGGGSSGSAATANDNQASSASVASSDPGRTCTVLSFDDILYASC